MANHYQTLGIPNFSSAKAVQKAFRRLALQYHPDKHGGNKFYEDKFKQLNGAYQVLSNASQKAIYDERLLYGTRIKTPPVNQSAPSKPQPHQQKKEGTSYKYEPKPERELTYSAFQKVFIKVSLGIMVMFTIIVFVFNTFHKRVNPEKQLHSNYKGLLERIEKSKMDNDFFLMEKQVDSIKYFNPTSSDNDLYTDYLCSEIASYANELFVAKDFQTSASYYNFYVRICDKYNYREIVGSKIRRIELHLIDGNIEAAEYLTMQIMDNNLSDVKSGLTLADVLLMYDQFKFAEFVVTKTVDNTLKAMNNRFGALYLDVIETGEVDVRMRDAMIQSVCLNRNSLKTDRTILEDFISRILKNEEYKEFYRAFKAEGFLKSNVMKKELHIKYEAYLSELMLTNFYK